MSNIEDLEYPRKKVYIGRQFSMKTVLWNKIEEVVQNLHLQIPTLFEDLNNDYTKICDILYYQGNLLKWGLNCMFTFLLKITCL